MGGWQGGSSDQGGRTSSSDRRCCPVDAFFPKLLDHETRASDQVPLLLTMKEDKLALLKAVDSGDTELGMCLSASLWLTG